MAKIIIGEMTFEGTIEELKQMGVKFPVEEEAQPEPLKVGDYAKVVGNGNKGPECPHPFEIGEIVTILQHAQGTKGPVFVSDSLLGGKGGVATVDVVRATDEEVAEAKRELAAKTERKELEEKWAKIGRKPNEFKKGDIVITKGSPAYKKGTLRIVKEVAPKGYGDYERGLTLEGGGWIYKHNVELITPVEARFDA
ncbi:hypothetical protein [Neobacillus niacini]|uniref:hypothetical protein n=1 Tax=Neobacillus niacini TaxID=86668 RepID=UPI0028604405|nr:hypothetical protein [Neobacillus niacini]MDR7001611.1 hypothetical protein [Neobacillus niacini]